MNKLERFGYTPDLYKENNHEIIFDSQTTKLLEENIANTRDSLSKLRLEIEKGDKNQDYNNQYKNVLDYLKTSLPNLGSKYDLTNILKTVEGRDELVNYIMIEAGRDEKFKKSLETAIIKNNPSNILSMFLGLNLNSPIDDLNNQVKGRKILEGLKSIGIRKDEKGIIVLDGEIPFKGIDFSHLSYKDVKETVDKLMRYKNDKETEIDFLKKIFTDGVKVMLDGKQENPDKKIIKLEIKPPKSNDGKITNSEFNEVITEGIQE